jgi:hypothetical protein
MGVLSLMEKGQLAVKKTPLQHIKEALRAGEVQPSPPPSTAASEAFLLAAGNKIVRWQQMVSKAEDTAPSVVIFNTLLMHFVTAAGGDVHVWDSRTGSRIRSFARILPGGEEVSAMALDYRQRKLYVGGVGGYLGAFSYISGECMKHLEPMESEVRSVHSWHEADCIIASTTEGSLRVYHGKDVAVRKGGKAPSAATSEEGCGRGDRVSHPQPGDAEEWVGDGTDGLVAKDVRAIPTTPSYLLHL